MMIGRMTVYLAQAGFMGIIFVLAGAFARAIWDQRRGRH